MQKINGDTSDDDTDETITFDDDKVKKTYRKDTNARRKRAKSVKTKKGRITKMYTINIKRKKLLKQRREKALQNAKDRKLAKENFLAALKADCKADRASNHIQSTANTNDELINGSNTDILISVENADNTAIAAENADNPATDTENIDNDIANAEYIDNAAINADTSNPATDSEKSEDAVMSNNNTDDAVLGSGNTENTVTGETSTEDVPSPLLYGRKTIDPSKVKTSKRHIPIRVKPSEPSIGGSPPDEIATAMVNGHAFDPTDV